MTQKELENIIPLKNEIKELKASTDAAPTYHGSVKGSDPNFPHLEHNVAVTGLEEDVLEDKERLKQYQAEYNRLIAYIDGIDDSLIRQILRLRYVKGFSWQQIAFKIGKHDESFPRRKHNKFLGIAENAEKQAV